MVWAARDALSPPSSSPPRQVRHLDPGCLQGRYCCCRRCGRASASIPPGSGAAAEADPLHLFPLRQPTAAPFLAFPAAMASTDEPVPQDENLRLADLRYTASMAPTTSEREEAAAALKAAIIDRKAVPLLVEVSAELVRFPCACRVSSVVWACSSVPFLVLVLPKPSSVSLLVSHTITFFHVDLAALVSLPLLLPLP